MPQTADSQSTPVFLRSHRKEWAVEQQKSTLPTVEIPTFSTKIRTFCQQLITK
jgi:hypothetical protein